MDNHQISIILPVYNASTYIVDTIQSVQNQTFINWELIVIDDGSSDDSLRILNQIAQTELRVSVYTQKNAGPASARNLGISKIKSPYLTFIDADDKIREDYLELLIQPILENPMVDLVCGGYYEQNTYNPEGIALHDFSAFKNQKYIDQSNFISNIFNGVSGVLWSKVFKTSIIQLHQVLLPTELKLSEDLIFVLRYAKHIKKIALVFEPVYYYNRLNDNGLSKRLDESYFTNFKLFEQLALNEIKENTDDVKMILNQSTGKLLLKTLKDQSSSKENLKYYYEIILKNFNPSILDFPKSKIDVIFLKLLKKNQFLIAYWQQKLIHLLRNIKHA
jgi:glycosyltransferase involved in cell wall biosynthesis